MMTPEPLCRFCFRQLCSPMDLNKDLPFLEPEYLYECFHCKSRQCFTTDGQSTHYQFTVGKYSLCFNPLTQHFRLIQLPHGTITNIKQLNQELIVELNYLPHQLTPSTVNEERIKTFILFS